jgi:hypothetical protein
MVATGRPLISVLDAICRYVEEQAEDIRCSVAFIDAELRIRPASAPSLSSKYSGGLDGVPVYPYIGPCALAACQKEQVISENIELYICETFLHVLEWETIPNDIIVDGTAKDAEQHINEVSFLERQIKVLIDAIRSTKTADLIPQLRIVARETIERMTDWKYEEEQKRLGLDLAGRAGQRGSHSCWNGFTAAGTTTLPFVSSYS